MVVLQTEGHQEDSGRWLQVAAHTGVKRPSSPHHSVNTHRDFLECWASRVLASRQGACTLCARTAAALD